VKISNKKISFFPSLNQYFPHIPYVASKKPPKYEQEFRHQQQNSTISKSSLVSVAANNIFFNRIFYVSVVLDICPSEITQKFAKSTNSCTPATDMSFYYSFF
jgi:hypothetical protein